MSSLNGNGQLQSGRDHRSPVGSRPHHSKVRDNSPKLQLGIPSRRNPTISISQYHSRRYISLYTAPRTREGCPRCMHVIWCDQGVVGLSKCSPCLDLVSGVGELRPTRKHISVGQDGLNRGSMCRYDIVHTVTCLRVDWKNLMVIGMRFPRSLL